MDVQFFNPADFALILPQVQLALFGLGILLTDFLLERRHKQWNAVMAMLGLGFSGYSLWRLRGVEATGFGGSILVDSFAVFFGFLFLAATALVVLLSVRYLEIEAEHSGEYYALALFATIGMQFMVTGADLIVLLIGLETMAISFYVLVGYLRRDRRSNEAALKYLLLGAFSSGVFAYGFSVLYGMAGSTQLAQVSLAFAERPPGDVMALLAVITVSAGLLFKVAAVPFHQWAPDVYEGAPTTITAYVSVASKAASFALLMRLYFYVFEPARPNWEFLLGVIGVATMTLGNFAAITQTNVKRLLAYSSIAHVGYILLGIVSGNETGVKGMAFYLLAYAFMTIGAFAVVILLRREGVIGDELEDMNGLFHRRPGAALLMLVFLISLAGLPPTAGFVGKYFIILSLLETGHYTLAIFAALYIVVALYYYFRIVVHMWMREATDVVRPEITAGQAVALGVAVAVVLAGGIYPEPFVELAKYSVFLR